MLAISAYMFLLKNVRPAVATSYAYVNPVVAVLLGIGFAGESLSPTEWGALAVIVSAVVLVTLGKFCSHAVNLYVQITVAYSSSLRSNYITRLFHTANGL